MRRNSWELSDAFAHVVKQQREAKQMSRAALAEKAGLHQTYIGLLERGHRSPNLDTMNAIAAGLSTRLSELLIEAEKISRRK